MGYESTNLATQKMYKPQHGLSWQDSALPLHPQLDTPLQGKNQLPSARSEQLIFHMVFSLRQMTLRCSKRKTQVRVFRHGRTGLPSPRALPRLLGVVIGTYIIWKLKTFL